MLIAKVPKKPLRNSSKKCCLWPKSGLTPAAWPDMMLVQNDIELLMIQSCNTGTLPPVSLTCKLLKEKMMQAMLAHMMPFSQAVLRHDSNVEPFSG